MSAPRRAGESLLVSGCTIRRVYASVLRISGARSVSNAEELVLCGRGWRFDAFRDVPAMAAFVERLAAFARVVQFDRRGVGLSDAPRGAETVPLEARVDDLAAVLDAVRSSCAGGGHLQ